MFASECCFCAYTEVHIRTIETISRLQLDLSFRHVNCCSLMHLLPKLKELTCAGA